MDSHGQSEVAFAFCHLLGTVRLMACLKRIKYERLYLPREKDRRRLSESGGVFARPIRWDLIEQQYDEMVKAAVALKRDTATAEAILKRYNSYNLTHPTYKALAEVGKAEKSIFLCEYLPSQETQHEVQEGLNVVENRMRPMILFVMAVRASWPLANSREQQEIVTLSLQLLQNCLILINTILVEQTIEREGVWERLSAKIFEHRHRCFTDTSIPMNSLPSTSTVRHFSRLPDHLQTASKQMAARLTVSV